MASRTITRLSMDGSSLLLLLLQVVMLLFCCNSVHCRSRNGPAIKCPSSCDCSIPRHSQGVIIDCSRAKLATIPVTQMDPDTIKLDMSHNRIRRVQTDTFRHLGKLQYLLLNDNSIDNVEPNAFSGLGNLRLLDLKRNNLRSLKKDSMARVSGHPTMCVGPNNACVMDLSENDLEMIQMNAFSWINRLGIVLGSSDRPLTLKTYALYGMQNIPSITIADVPFLTLERHAIANVERCDSVRIMNTRLADIYNFTFQSLQDVGSIVFHNSELSQISSMGFGGVRYDPSIQTTILNPITDKTEVLTGGLFNMSYCQVAQLDPDLFRDTNLAHIFLTGNTIHDIAGAVFNGLDSLKTLHMVGNTINTLSTGSLGSLSGLQALILERNQIDTIEADAFRGSREIELFRMSLKLGTNLTLNTHAFSGVLGVNNFEIIGNSPVVETSSFTKTTILINPDAFYNFVADRITIENVSLPTLKENTFRGMSRVKHLVFVSCEVQEIQPGAFGTSYGTVNNMVMTQDSQLTCDCDTHRLLAEFKRTFATYDVHCNTSPQPATHNTPAVPSELVPVQDVEWEFCRTGGGSNLRFNVAVLIGVVVLSTHFLL